MKEINALLSNSTSGVPKLTTAVNFNKLDNGYIVISFLSEVKPANQPILIETILVDEQHAQQIVNILKEVIDKKI